MTTPLELFQADRSRAREAGDPMAAVCVLATVSDEGQPEARTLVLRLVEEQLALFMQAHGSDCLLYTSDAADE